MPSKTSEVERRAVQESTRAAGAREVFLAPSPMATALGAGLAVTAPMGCMVVDIGAGKTEVAVISLGGMVVSHTTRVAGDAMDEAIAFALRSRHNTLVGEQTAEELKVSIGAATATGEERSKRVRGRDVSSGRPREIDLTTADIAEALVEPLGQIRDAVLEVLKRTPPELSADILEHGLLLCGGSARLPGIGELLRDATGLPVVVSDKPTQCTVTGAGRLLEDADLFARVVATG